MLPFEPEDAGVAPVCPPVWLHANCERFVVQQMKHRGWPQDEIDTWFRNWRDDEPNSEKEDEWMDTGIASPFPHPIIIPGGGYLQPPHTIARCCCV